jgi:hypothetical protein
MYTQFSSVALTLMSTTFNHSCHADPSEHTVHGPFHFNHNAKPEDESPNPTSFNQNRKPST